MTRLAFFLLLVTTLACRTAGISGTPPAPVVTEKHDPAEEKKEKEKKEEKQKERKKAVRNPSPLSPEVENDFSVALLMPLYLNKGGIGDYRMDPFLADYYEGILLALDSLRAMGINLKLYVWDTKEDTLLTRILLRKPEMKEMDLIIGPFFKEGFQLVSRFSKERAIPLVSPFSTAYLEKDENPYSLYCNPDQAAQIRTLVTYIKKEYADAVVTLVNDGNVTTKSFIDDYQSAAAAKYLPRARVVDVSKDMSFRGYLHPTLQNIVLVPTDNEMAANSAINALKDIRDSAVMIFGLGQWLSFRNIDYTVWERLHIHVISPYYVNESEGEPLRFRINYRNKFQGEPSEFSYRGFDQMMFFGTALMTFGKEFPTYIRGRSFPYMHSHFYFKNAGKALENEYINILRFENYRFHRQKISF